ncbi:MAG: hypothetical protein IT383_14505 [Deltaproteobacteria bacterium]|nr:hypothetical protein [Deltaproteobacteria bacterium]
MTIEVSMSAPGQSLPGKRPAQVRLRGAPRVTKALFDPIDLSPEDEARAFLASIWPDPAQLPWLIDALRPLTPLRYIDDDQLHLLHVAKSLVNQLDDGDGADVALLRFIVELHRDHPESTTTHASFVATASDHGVDFSLVLTEYKPRKGDLRRRAAATSLLSLGARLRIDLDPLWTHAAAEAVGAYPKTWGGDEERAEEENARGFTFWMLTDPRAALAEADRRLSAASDDDLPTTAKAFLTGIGRCLSSTSREPKHHPTNYRDAAAGVQDGAQRLLGVLYPRALDREGALLRVPLFVEDLFRLWRIAFDGREQETPDGMRSTLLDVAKRELARARKELTASSADAAPAVFEGAADHIEATSRILFTLRSLWTGMKPLLLLMRHSPIPLVERDLSWWTRKGLVANDAALSVGSQLMWSFQAFARFEQSEDRDLLALRTELARFCVERCKTNKERGEPTEPNPVWRAAALRALGELGVNPDGKAHQLLHRLIEDDHGDADVRAAAKRVYPAVRQKSALPADMSPRRAVLNALWWFRQAHLVALGVEVDADGAQRTRSEEARFTTKGGAH